MACRTELAKEEPVELDPDRHQTGKCKSGLGVCLLSDPDKDMEEGVPTVSVTGVAARFVSETDIDAARSRREQQWKAAYARSAAPFTSHRVGFLHLF